MGWMSNILTLVGLFCASAAVKTDKYRVRALHPLYKLLQYTSTLVALVLVPTLQKCSKQTLTNATFADCSSERTELKQRLY